MTKTAGVPDITMPGEPPALTPALAAALLTVMRAAYPGGKGASPVPSARPPLPEVTAAMPSDNKSDPRA